MGNKRNDTLEVLSTVLIVAILLWVVWSWLEIVAHNRTDCQYSAINLWVLVLKMCNVGRGA
jgi:hypothetical protein